MQIKGCLILQVNITLLLKHTVHSQQQLLDMNRKLIYITIAIKLLTRYCTHILRMFFSPSHTVRGDQLPSRGRIHAVLGQN